MGVCERARAGPPTARRFMSKCPGRIGSCRNRSKTGARWTRASWTASLADGRWLLAFPQAVADAGRGSVVLSISGLMAQPSSRLSPWLMLAVALHALLLRLSPLNGKGREPALNIEPIDRVEVSLWEEQEEQPVAAAAGEEAESRGSAGKSRSGLRAGGRSAPDFQARPAASPEIVAAEPFEPDVQAERVGELETQHQIDLGLNGSVTRSAILALRAQRVAEATPEASITRVEPRKPSVGLLEEGLALADAQRGMSRSGAAVSAGYGAARSHAPAAGAAVFDVQTDATGSVISVTLVSAAADRARWNAVAEALQAQLKNRKLRVPKGAKGLLTRLRIERGEMAKSRSARDHLERRGVVGQEPLDARDKRQESTRDSSEGRELAPTLGIDVANLRKPIATRVVLLNQREL